MCAIGPPKLVRPSLVKASHTSVAEPRGPRSGSLTDALIAIADTGSPPAASNQNEQMSSNEALEQLHVDQLAGSYVAHRALQHDEAVRLGHRRQDAGALVAGRAHGPAAVGIG